MSTIEEVIAVAVASALRNRVSPTFSILEKRTVTGEGLSEDERGLRSSFSTEYTLHFQHVSKEDYLAMFAGELGIWVIGKGEGEALIAAASAAAWTALGHTEPLPTNTTTEVLSTFEEGEKIVTIHREVGPSGVHVFAKYTYPKSKHGIILPAFKIARGTFYPSKKRPGFFAARPGKEYDFYVRAEEVKAWFAC